MSHKYRKVYGGDGKHVTPRVQTTDGKKFQKEPSVEETHTREELEKLAESIWFTKQFLAKESAAKYEEEVDSDPIIKI